MNSFGKSLALILLFSMLGACKPQQPVSDSQQEVPKLSPFVWENATIYFLLTDRFLNGDPANDFSMGRKQDGAMLRSFMGGDFKGITQKIREGYFDKLGITALWMTPPVEQIASATNEGTGKTYGFHGYWTRDWTRPDPNYGTEAEFQELVDTAHKHGIRILMDAVLNHTGPVTAVDTQWPDDWVRTSPTCDFQTFKGTVECTLVDNLPDIRTESNEDVDLPSFLVEKWKAEGAWEGEKASLNAFFARTGHPRAPRFYIMKWLTDWVRKYGIDGFRVDTAKHTEPEIWSELKALVVQALRDWKRENPAKKLDDLDFYMTAEVYNYFADNGRMFDFGDQQVDFFDYGFESLINFSFKSDATRPPAELHAKYASLLHSGPLQGVSVVNYLSSHDDGQPFDKSRERALDAATQLLLSPGAAQVYYGDETARTLEVSGASGDAHLRSFMNWEEIESNTRRGGHGTAEVLAHWQKLGVFRKEHLAVGAGTHTALQAQPYIFKREYVQNGITDKVLVALGLDAAPATHTIRVYDVFADGDRVTDYYSGKESTVQNGELRFGGVGTMLLLAGQ